MPSEGKNLSCKTQGNQVCKDTELLQKSFSCSHWCLSGVGWWADLGQKVSKLKSVVTKEFGAQVTQRWETGAVPVTQALYVWERPSGSHTDFPPWRSESSEQQETRRDSERQGGNQCDFWEELSHLDGERPTHLQARGWKETPPHSTHWWWKRGEALTSAGCPHKSGTASHCCPTQHLELILHL